jgi:hypothetical protein
MSAKLERDFVAADLAAVEGLLNSMTDEDILTSFSLESRRDELRQTLAGMIAEPETRASAGGGKPRHRDGIRDGGRR